MTAGLRFTPAAELDLATAYSWYQARRQGLGVRFLDSVEQLVGRIRESPGLFPEVITGFRRGLLHSFPYGIYFALESGTVVILAVLHLHRNPDSAHRRLRDASG